MRSLTIGTKNTWTDFGLAIQSINIGVPEVKQYRVELPGGDGELDFTEFFGGAKLNDRTIEVELVYTKYPSDIPQELLYDVVNEWHGRKLTIIDSLDPDYEFTGRVMLADLNGQPNFGTIRLTAVCSPYRLETSPTDVDGIVPADGSISMTLSNLRMPVKPMITVSAETTVTYNTVISAVSAGTFQLWSPLAEGENVISFSAEEGTTINITYTRGLI